MLSALFRIGADARDDEDAHLRKVLLLGAAYLILPAAILWGAVYFALGQPTAAFVPWIYAAFTPFAIATLAATRNYGIFAIGQFTMMLTLPFVLMWALGGFVAGSVVALWAWTAPLVARTVGHRRAAAALFVLFALGMVLSALLEPVLEASSPLPDEIILTFFVLNVTVVGGITFLLIDASAGGREGSLAAMRGMARRYFSTDVLDTILADPARQELGGEIADVTILFADMGGFTALAGSQRPQDVVEVLNTTFAAAMPAIIAEGGTPVSLPGDAVMAVFGAPQAQRDHAIHAARAALRVQAAVAEIVASHPSWPRLRIGVNSGEALVGNIGSAEFRNFTAIGDAANMAQRLQTLAEPGQVVIGPQTAARLDGRAELAPLGPLQVKGRAEPIEPSVLLALRDRADR